MNTCGRLMSPAPSLVLRSRQWWELMNTSLSYTLTSDRLEKGSFIIINFICILAPFPYKLEEFFFQLKKALKKSGASWSVKKQARWGEDDDLLSVGDAMKMQGTRKSEKKLITDVYSVGNMTIDIKDLPDDFDSRK